MEVDAEPQSKISQEDEEELLQLDRDVRKMFYLSPDQSLKDVTWPQIIDKFRDHLNKCQKDISNVYMREVQDAPHMAPRDVSLDDEITEMLGRIDGMIKYALEHKTQLGPLTEIQILLQRMQRMLQIDAQEKEVWMRLFHVMVEKTKEDAEPEGPAFEDEVQAQFDAIKQVVKESTEVMQRTADDYKRDAEAATSKLDTRIKHVEADFAKHKACKLAYCHKGKTNNKPAQEEEEEEAPKKGKSKKR